MPVPTNLGPAEEYLSHRQPTLDIVADHNYGLEKLG